MILVLQRDLLSHEKEEARLQVEREKLKSTLLRSISHDLRTPLTSIAGGANFLVNTLDTVESVSYTHLDVYKRQAYKIPSIDQKDIVEIVSSATLTKGDIVLVKAGQQIPGDGEVIDGVASVDESAITGESAPVIRESGGDRSAVTGGTTVLSDWIVVQISSEPGESFLDKMISMVEGANRKKTPNEMALQIFLVALSIIFVLVTMEMCIRDRVLVMQYLMLKIIEYR